MKCPNCQIDSLSHAWAGEGGLLDMHGHYADRSGNSWAAWRTHFATNPGNWKFCEGAVG